MLSLLEAGKLPRPSNPGVEWLAGHQGAGEGHTWHVRPSPEGTGAQQGEGTYPESLSQHPSGKRRLQKGLLGVAGARLRTRTHTDKRAQAREMRLWTTSVCIYATPLQGVAMSSWANSWTPHSSLPMPQLISPWKCLAGLWTLHSPPRGCTVRGGSALVKAASAGGRVLGTVLYPLQDPCTEVIGTPLRPPWDPCTWVTGTPQRPPQDPCTEVLGTLQHPPRDLCTEVVGTL